VNLFGTSCAGSEAATMHGEDSVKLFVGSLHARDLNMAAAIAKVAAHIQTVRHDLWARL